MRVRALGPLVVALAITLALPPLPARAQGSVDTSRRDELQREIQNYQQLLEARERDLGNIEEALGDTSSALRQRIAERDRVAAEINELRRRREALQAEMRTLEAQLVETQARIEATRERLESLKHRIQGLLLNLYQQRTGRFARVLAQSESFHELQLKNRYLSMLSEQDVELVRELDVVQAELLDAQNALTEGLAARAATEEQLRANQASLESKEAELATVIAELESTRAGQLAQRQSLLESQNRIESTLGNLQNELSAEIQRLREEEERLRREAAQTLVAERERQRLQQQADAVGQRIQNLTTPIAAPTSGYVYPVAGPSVLSRYGQDNNSFMALRASAANAAVMAVQDGVVRIVSAVSANDGYLVAVAHSDRLSTVYTNLRPPLVKVGDRVKKGDVIGYLGGGTLVPADVLKLWVQVTENGRAAFVDPATVLGF